MRGRNKRRLLTANEGNYLQNRLKDLPGSMTQFALCDLLAQLQGNCPT